MVWPKVYRKTVLLIIFFLLVIGGMVYLFASGDDEGIWFDDIKDTPALTSSDEESIIKRIEGSILHNQRVHDGEIDDHEPRILFVSISDGVTKARVIIGRGVGIDGAAENALSVIDDLKHGGYVPVWVKIDIVKNTKPLLLKQWDRGRVNDRSLSGLAFSKDTGIAFLPEELVAAGLVNRRGVLQTDKITAYSPNKKSYLDQLFQKKPPRLHTFTTESYFTDGTEVTPLYRGHRMYDTVTQGVVRDALLNAAQYMKASVGPKGKFEYSYRPTSDSISNRYNILRHGGTVYAMLELYKFTGDGELLGAAKKALDYLVDRCKPCHCLSGAACVEEKGFVKLGGNALALIALAKYYQVTSDVQYIPVMKRLARWIQSVQRMDGSFAGQKVRYLDCRDRGFISEYYPGEAILAMLRLYAIDGDETWLDVAERGALYLIEVRDGEKGTEKLAHDHWLLYGLNELCLYRPRPEFSSHALRIAEAIMNAQNRSPRYSDWRGSFYRPPRSTPTATRMEGLSAAYRIALRNKKEELSKKILYSITEGVKFQLQTQLQPESVLYVKNPPKALGGFRRSLTNFEVRIDYVQHNISSMIAFYCIREEMEKKRELKQ